ncbi:heparan-alpha-glucosaminide N-acetyltransferase domain-containing protein [Gandjariella thermophila]|uniref:Heparan-alpha-glucosaminide N-acetyltransferase catalytic domain-containing protein n=1 Tax=Gandjariella thermophila TaxID=1931992 RepID=A0A4D4JHR8_9PSEU|nr:heparan-alpha-glucosaminide N-acetyltransferase domain-containing protein [Gandjariella thermophila]GDY33427.1 hypothetical protein GTS_50600 [Gandjariella thermophila]
MSAGAARSRLVGVDATRGVALLGMIAVHSLYEQGPSGRPTLSFAVFGGRAAATFAVLAGVGIAFMTGRCRVRPRDAGPTAAALVTRALAIGAIGLALGVGTDAALGAVILPYYAIMFLLAVPLVFLPTPLVAALAVVVAGGTPVLSHVLFPHLPPPSLTNPTLGSLLHQPLALLSELSLTGEYPAVPWMAYLAAGIVVGRLNLARLRVALALLATGAVLAAGAAAASWLLLGRYGGLAHIWAAQPGSVLTAPETTEMLTLGGDGTTPTSTWWWLAVNAPHTSTPPDLVHTTGTAVSLLGALLALGHLTRPAVRRAVHIGLAPLSAAGSMTLTCYALHIEFINSDYDTYGAGTGYVLQVIALLLLGLAWRATAGRGPLESLVTTLARRARACAERAPRRTTPAGSDAVEAGGALTAAGAPEGAAMTAERG